MVDPLGTGGTMRMFGLASGMDIDSMVEKLMNAERIPLDKLTQDKQLLQWKQDDYRSMNSLLLDLYNSTFDMTLQSNYLLRSTVSSDTTAVTATAGNNAAKTSYTLTGGKMATAAYNVSSTNITNTSIDPTESLWNMRGAFVTDPFLSVSSSEVAVSGEAITAQADGTYKLANGYVDPTKLSFSDTTMKVYYSKAQYDADTTANKVYVNAVTGNLTFGQTPSSSLTASYSYLPSASVSSASFSLSVQTADGTYSNSFNATQSLNDVMNAINSSNAQVSMFYDDSAKKVSITRNKTGNYVNGTNEMVFTGNFLTQTLALNGTETDGKDSQVTINGLTSQHHENTFTVNGVTFNILKDFSTSSVNVTVSDDTSAIYDKIKSWVDKYNDTIQKINDTLSEKRYRDYPPLTDAQKKDMKDNDITLWNEKAMSGMLSDDRLLPSGLDQMRMDIYTAVNSVSDSNYNQLAEIGITTSNVYTDKGKLEIDPTKLQAAIAANPNAVVDLFTKSGIPSGGSKPVYADEGIMQRLRTTIQNTMDSIYQEAGKSTYTYDQYFLGKDMHEYDQRISDMKDHLNDVQNRYYRQFTAMEQAIEAANQQGSFLTQNFGG